MAREGQVGCISGFGACCRVGQFYCTYSVYSYIAYQGDLTDAVASSRNFTDNAIQEKIQEYRDAYGALPDEFLKLLEDRDDG